MTVAKFVDESMLRALRLLGTISRRRIKLSPVLARNGRVDWWQAGFQRVNKTSGLNYVKETEFAHGAGPLEAVENLLAGRTFYKRKNGRLVISHRMTSEGPK